MSQPDMKRIYEYLKEKKYGVEATVNKKNPQAAVVGIAVSRDLEVIFDTEKTTRKYMNFLDNPEMAFVIGWDDETTIQMEGIGREVSGKELKKYQGIYFEKFPDGKERSTWPEIVYIVMKPYWIRLSDFTKPEPLIEEWVIN